MELALHGTVPHTVRYGLVLHTVLHTVRYNDISCAWANTICTLNGLLQFVFLVSPVKAAGVAAGLQFGHLEGADYPELNMAW
jgi:hypothetical protein